MKAAFDLNRRNFLKSAGILGAAGLAPSGPLLASSSASVPSPRRKAPYKVIYSNDTTNITTCIGPYHHKGEGWRPEMLEASVDEVAGHGVDAHLIQLAHGQVPWYQSKIYPMAEHHRWWQQHFGVDPENDAFNVGGVHRFILDGGDPLQVFVNRCRKTGQAPFVSMRMNDVHHVEYVNTPGNTRGIHAISRFYAEHPEWRIGNDLNDWYARTLNWAVPQVRDWVFGFVAEQNRNYDLDGFELDFLRIPSFFRLNETTSAERRQIMTGFIRRVRAVMDEDRSRRHRWLSVRIPCYTAGFDSLGIYLPDWIDAGVDMVNVSPFYFTVQQNDLGAIRAMAPTASIYQEMCHSTWNGKAVAKGYDAFTFRRTTPEQYETTAHLAYHEGADGVSLFNFVYYREHGIGERGPFNEPPFFALDHLGDPAYLAKRPQHWIASPGWKPPFGGAKVDLPRRLRKGEKATFFLTLAEPDGRWQKTGRLRIQCASDIGSSRWTASMNGTTLEPTSDLAEPYANPYPPLVGKPEEMRGWLVPNSVLRDGGNQIIVSLDSEGDHQIEFIDVAVS